MLAIPAKNTDEDQILKIFSSTVHLGFLHLHSCSLSHQCVLSIISETSVYIKQYTITIQKLCSRPVWGGNLVPQRFILWSIPQTKLDKIMTKPNKLTYEWNPINLPEITSKMAARHCWHTHFPQVSGVAVLFYLFKIQQYNTKLFSREATVIIILIKIVP